MYLKAGYHLICCYDSVKITQVENKLNLNPW